MEQEKSKKKSKLWLWLVIAAAALLVIGGIIAAIFLFGPGSGDAEATYDAKLYWNLDRALYLDEEFNMSNRTKAEDGYYHMRFLVDGQVQEMKVIDDKRLVNFLDAQSAVCLILDENGIVVEAVSVSEHFAVVATDVYVKKQEGNKLEANSSIAMNGMAFNLTVSEGVGPYDVSVGAENPGAVVTCKWLDQISIYNDLEGNLEAIFVTDNKAVDGEVAWRTERFYANGKTTRVPDENGVYTIEFLIDGKIVERKCKDETILSLIDSRDTNNAGFALVYDEEGYICDYADVALALRGFLLCQNYTVESIDENGVVFSSKQFGSAAGKTATFTFNEETAKNCKIYNVCTGNCQEKQFGEELKEPRVGDTYMVYTDLENNPILMYATTHKMDSPAYYNLNAGNTTRVDEDGWYNFELAVNGKIKKVRTKDSEIARQIDVKTAACMGLKLSGNIVKQVYMPQCVSGGYVGFYGSSVITGVTGPIVTVANSSDLRTQSNFVMTADCEVYIVGDNYGVKRGSVTELQQYDIATGLVNRRGELTHVFVTQRYSKGHTLCYNMKRMYAKGSTTREPDAEGYYVFDIALNGTVKQYKTKNKTLASFIDKQSPTVLGIKVSGDIIKSACTAGSAIQCGATYYNGSFITSLKDNLISSYWINKGVRQPFNYSYSTEGSKAYDISELYKDHLGEKTKVKVGDRIQGVVDLLTGKMVYIAVLNRQTKSPLYWNINAAYKTVDPSVADADGYYNIQLAVDGSIKTYKTKDQALMKQIQSYSDLPFGMTLKSGTNIVERCFSYKNTKYNTLAVSYADVTSIKGSTVNTCRYRLSAGDYGTEASITTYKNTKVYDLSYYAGSKYAKASKLKVGDRIVAFHDADGNLAYCFITKAAARDKGVFGYCSHCNKKVFWDAYSESFMLDNAHYYLPADLTREKAITIGSSLDDACYNAVFDLNGHTITSATNVFNIKDNVTIIDSAGGGKIIGGTAIEHEGKTQGGNILVYEGATLTLAGGTVADGQATILGYGSNIAATNGTVNITGGTISGGVGYLGTAIYHSGTKGGINISGGKITGTVYAEETNKVTVSGKPVINKLLVEPGAKIKLGKLVSGASITVKAEGVFTNTSSEINTYKKYFKPADKADVIAVKSGALAYTNNSGAVIPEPPSPNAPLELDANGMGMCNACGKEAQWIPLHNGEKIGDLDASVVGANSHHHYYVAEDMISADLDFLSARGISAGGVNVCLHLNGKTLNTVGGIYVAGMSRVNIMGEGTINHLAKSHYYAGSGYMFDCFSVDVYLYGGTFETNGTFINSRANTKLYISDEAHINENIVLSTGYVTLDDAATVQKMTISGGKLTVNSTFTGSAVVDYASGLIGTGGVVNAANGASTGAYTGSVIDSTGKVIVGKNGKLVVTADTVTPPTYTDEPHELNPNLPLALDANGKGMCNACGKLVQWTPLHNGEKIGKVYASEHGANSSHHYYLAEDMTASNLDFIDAQGVTAGGVNVCFHLNGKTLNTVGGIYIGGYSKLNIMGDGTINHLAMSSFTARAGYFIDCFSCEINLLGGVYETNGSFLCSNSANAVLNISDKAVVNETITLTKGTINLDDAATVQKLVINGGKLNVAESFTGSAVVDFAASMIGSDGAVNTANGASTGAYTGTVIDSTGKVIAGQNGKLVVTSNTVTPPTYTDDPFALNPNAKLALDANGKGLCNVCSQYVQWTALNDGDMIGELNGVKGSTNTHHHYYLAENVTSGNDDFFQAKGAPYSGKICSVTVCLHLNGKKLDVVGGGYISGWSTVNFMGQGDVNFLDTCTNATVGGHNLFAMESSYLHLYGGNYSSVSGFLSSASANAQFHVHSGAQVNETVSLSKGTIFLDGSAAVQKIDISGTGKLTVNAGFSGCAAANFASTLIESGNVIKAANASASAFTGVLKNSDGRDLVHQNGRLAISSTVPSPNADLILTENNAGFCSLCGMTVTWTPVENGVNIGTVDANVLGTNAHAHYYLKGNMISGDGVFLEQKGQNKGLTVCLHLNGKRLDMKGGIYVDGSGVLNIMGTGTINHLNTTTVGAPEMFQLWTSTVNLYGGTYESNKTFNNNYSANAKINVLENARINENVVLSKGTLTLDGAAVVEKVAVSGTGKLVVNSTFTGSAMADIASGLITGGVVNAANGVSTGAYTGSVYTAAGNVITGTSGGLTVTSTTITPPTITDEDIPAA